MNEGRDLLRVLRESDLLDYGSVIETAMVHDALGITVPEVASRAKFNELELLELGAIDYVRNVLLNDGKYIAACAGGYRILLPSENKKQVEAYIRSADKKNRRAHRLSVNTPVQHTTEQDQTNARIHFRQHSHRRGMQAAHP